MLPIQASKLPLAVGRFDKIDSGRSLGRCGIHAAKIAPQSAGGWEAKGASAGSPRAGSSPPAAGRCQAKLHVVPTGPCPDGAASAGGCSTGTSRIPVPTLENASASDGIENASDGIDGAAAWDSVSVSKGSGFDLGWQEAMKKKRNHKGSHSDLHPVDRRQVVNVVDHFVDHVQPSDADGRVAGGLAALALQHQKIELQPVLSLKLSPQLLQPRQSLRHRRPRRTRRKRNCRGPAQPPLASRQGSCSRRAGITLAVNLGAKDWHAKIKRLPAALSQSQASEDEMGAGGNERDRRKVRTSWNPAGARRKHTHRHINMHTDI